MAPGHDPSSKRPVAATAPARTPSRRDVLKGAAAAGVALGGGIPDILQAQTAPAAGGPVTLNVLLWEHWKVAEGLQKNDPTNVPKRRLWFYETIKQFEADHKDIKLQYQTANWNVATQTFIAASQAGNPPDVLGAQSQDNQPLANASLVGDLDQFKYTEWDDFNQPVLREACSVGGKIVAMPVYLTSTGLGYNNNYAPVTISPNGTAYVGVLGGLTRFRDAAP